MKITKTKTGKYTARVFLGTQPDGRKILKRITAPSKEDILLMELDLRKEKIQAERLTLKSAMHRYNDSRSNILSPSTMISYIRYADRVFSDELYDKDLNQISDDDIQKEANRLSKKVSPKTVRNYIFYLVTVMEEYTRNRKVKVVLPKKKKVVLHIPSDDDIQKIYEAVQNTDLELPVLLASQCGLRRSEIAALTYDDVNEDTMQISIAKATVRDPDKNYTTKAPKSYAGYRHVDINEHILQIIKERHAKGLPMIELHADIISSRFRRLIDRIGLHGIRFHNLRHYYATILLELGIPDKFAIELTGHSTTYMLREVYQHTRDQKMNEYRQLIQAKLSNS